MVLTILAAVLILGIAFHQTIQGLFSAMIMAILTVLSAAIAFNFYEQLAGVIRMGEFAQAASLMALFAIPLLLLRTAFDRVIRMDVEVDVWASRIGGGLLGLVSGTIIAGVLLLVVQLLPLPAKILFYEPYDGTLRPSFGGPASLAADATLGLMKRLSAGSLQPIARRADMTKVRFGDNHNELRLEAFCRRARPVGGRTWAPPDALEVDYACRLPAANSDAAAKLPDPQQLKTILDQTPSYRKPLVGQAGTKVLVVRVRVDELARNDKDNWFRLPATHFRMVDKQGGSHYPVGYLTHAGIWQVQTSQTEAREAKVADILVARPWQEDGGPKKLSVDWLFRVPDKVEPARIVFRSSSAADILVAAEGMPKTTGALSPKPLNGQADFAAPPAPWLLVPEQIVGTSDLPETISLKNAEGADRPAPVKSWVIADKKLRSARISGSWEALKASGPGEYATQFQVPAGRFGIVQVQCKVDPSLGVTKAELSGCRPVLILRSGTVLPHKGAVYLYDSGSRQVEWYYDAARANAPLDAGLVDKLLDPNVQPRQFHIQFAVPIDKNEAIVMLELRFAGGEPRRFALSRPMSCALR